MSDNDENPPIRLYWDIAGESTTLGRTAADVASGYFTMARAAGRQAFAEAVVRIFLGEPNLHQLQLEISFENVYDDQGGYFKSPTLFATARFEGMPVNALQGQCEGYDPELVSEDGLELEEAVDLWTEVCRDVLEPEAGWLDEPDVWEQKLSASRGGLHAATRNGVIDLAAFWLHLTTMAQADESAQAQPLPETAA